MKDFHNATIKEIPDYFSIPFACGNLAGRGHRKKAERTLKELRGKIEDMVKDFSANSENVNRPPEMNETKNLTEALETIDDMVDSIGKLVISIAHSNDDFICTECMYTAKMLYQIMRKYAREDDAARIYEEFQEITGRNIDD